MNTNKTLYGILAFAPLVLMIPMFFIMFSMFAEIFENPHSYTGNRMPSSFGTMMLFSVFAGVVGLVGMILYLIHATKNPHIPDSSRTMWILILVLAGTIGMIIYFFTWIKKEEEFNARKQQETSPWK
jgi:hypothetical protein